MTLFRVPAVGLNRYLCGVMSAVYFISDVHIGMESHAEERAKEERLLQLLDRLGEDASELYILGDLFDFWFEYRHVVPRQSPRVLGSLRRLADGGTRVHYMAGNHDFALGPYLVHEVGCAIYDGPLETQIGDARFMLHHGDGLAGRDIGYRILRRILRNRIARFLWRWLHPDVGVAFARWLSRVSRRYTSGKDFGPDERVYANIERLTAGRSLDFLLMGHTHSVDDRVMSSGVRYLNLGTWVGGGAPYARFADGTLEVTLPHGSRGSYRAGEEMSGSSGASPRP